MKSVGVAKQNKFYVEINLPPQLTGLYDSREMEMLNLFVEQTQFPEFVLATQSSNATGTHIEMPYDKLFGQVGMTFLCDQSMLIKHFFDRWCMSVMNTSGGVLNYYSDYVSPSINIYQHNTELDAVYVVSLFNVYPKVVNDIILSSGSGDISRFQTIFTFEQWRSYKLPPIQKMTEAGIKNPFAQNVQNTLTSAASFINQHSNSLLGTDIIPSFDVTPGIDTLTSATGISNGLELLSKLRNPQQFKDALRRQAGSFVSESTKGIKRAALEKLPQQVRQIGGSAWGFGSSSISKKLGL